MEPLKPVITQWEDVDLNVLAVSLPRSVERRERLAARLHAAQIKFDVIDAIDGDDESLVRSLYVCDPSCEPTIYDHRKVAISGREIACTLSHMKAVREAYVRGFDHTLICEDDFELGDVSAIEMAGILECLPKDTGYLQLCITPEQSMRRLFEYYCHTGRLLARKSIEYPTIMEDTYFNGFPYHCATAYIVTSDGARNLYQKYFVDDKIVFPCHSETLNTNAALLADRFIYRACTDQHIRGYVYSIPTVTYEALDSLLHPDHLSAHLSTKIAALELRKAARAQSARRLDPLAPVIA